MMGVVHDVRRRDPSGRTLSTWTRRSTRSCARRGAQASHGVLITTRGLSTEAPDYAERVPPSLVLIDGTAQLSGGWSTRVAVQVDQVVKINE